MISHQIFHSILTGSQCSSFGKLHHYYIIVVLYGVSVDCDDVFMANFSQLLCFSFELSCFHLKLNCHNLAFPSSFFYISK